MVNEGDKLQADPRWEVIGTGGGCTALSRTAKAGDNVQNPSGPYWLITTEAASPETMDEPVVLGLYPSDGGEVIGEWDCLTVWAALAIANGMGA